MKLLKKIIIILLAFMLCAASVFAESMYGRQATKTQQEQTMIISGNATIKRAEKNLTSAEKIAIKAGDLIVTDKTSIADIKLSADTYLRLAPDTTIKISTVENKGTLLILQQGRIWFNNQFSSQVINLQAGNIVIIPQKAIFDLSFNGDSGNLLVNKNQVEVGLLNSTNVLKEAIKPYDPLIVNHFLVTKKSQISFRASTISSQSEALKKLLYSKLVKEFQYGSIEASRWESDTWLANNVKIDEKLIQKRNETLLQAIHQGTLHYSSLDAFGYQFDAALNRFSSTLTFAEDKNTERTINSAFSQLSDAEYLLVYGRIAEAKDRLSFFKQTIADFIQQKPNFQEKILEKLQQSYKELASISPDDPLYEAKNTLRETIFSVLGNAPEELITKFGLLHEMISNVSELASANASIARLTFDQYFKKLTDFLTKEKKTLAENKYLLAEENQIVDNLFRQHAEFYQDAFFAQKYNLERQWLSLLPEGNTKNEERQTIISTKIDFLKQLQSFFLNQKLPLDETRLIAFRLISEIKDLQPSNDVGVKELFALRLKDYGQFLRFLNNTDVASFQNSSPQKQYEAFLAAQKETISIEQAVDEFLGTQTQQKPSVEQILAKAHDDFEAASVTNVTFGSFTSSDQKTITVETAVYQNVAFSGDYDWDRKLISNIKVGNELKGQSAIRLENLGQVLVQPITQTQQTQIKVPKIPRTSSGATQQTQSITDASKNEKITKILLIQKLKSYDIAATADNIIIVDKTAGIYTIRNANLISNKNIIFDFRVNIKEAKADLVSVKLKIEKTLEESFALADLSAKLKTIK